MSWSVSLIGSAKAVAKALDAYGETQGGQSKVEFDEAKPHLQGLALANIGNGVLHLMANGHATFSATPSLADFGQVKTYGTCNVTIATLSGKIVTEE